VVEGREAPGSSVHPSTAPRLHPGPTAVAVGGASGVDARRPDPAVVGNFAPRAVGIQILVADGFAGNVAHGLRLLFALVAVLAPDFEIVGQRGGVELAAEVVVGARELGAFARVQGEGSAASGDFGIAAPDGYCGEAAVAIDEEAVFAR